MRILGHQEGPLCHQGKVQLIGRSSGVSWTSGSFVFFWYFVDLFTCFLCVSLGSLGIAEMNGLHCRHRQVGVSNYGGAGQWQWLHILMRNNAVASLMQGTMDLGACGLSCTDCALFLNGF
jgi:hypothetical protein